LKELLPGFQAIESRSDEFGLRSLAGALQFGRENVVWQSIVKLLIWQMYIDFTRLCRGCVEKLVFGIQPSSLLKILQADNEVQ
jgi:hypothetical protein